MQKRALKDNNTLRITKGKIYEMCRVGMVGTLVIVENDNGDNVVMSIYDFEKEG